jgi:hypothetical protein
VHVRTRLIHHACPEFNFGTIPRKKKWRQNTTILALARVANIANEQTTGLSQVFELLQNYYRIYPGLADSGMELLLPGDCNLLRILCRQQSYEGIEVSRLFPAA